jgi:hypothetical protein
MGVNFLVMVLQQYTGRASLISGRSSLRDLGTFGFGDDAGNTLAATGLLIYLEEAERPAVADGEKEGSNILETHV